MADDNTESPDNFDDVPFVNATKAAGGENYLGERGVVEALVRKTVADLLDKWQLIDNDDSAAKQRVMKMLATRAGLILLGKSPLFVPVHRWNEPGGIDEFLAKWQGSAETDPDDRMEHAFIELFDAVLSVAAYAGTEGVLPEQWQFQFDAEIYRFVSLCIGIDPPTQALMVTADSLSENNSDDEE